MSKTRLNSPPPSLFFLFYCVAGAHRPTNNKPTSCNQIEELTNFEIPSVREAKLRRMFRAADKDNSGNVSRGEFRGVLEQFHFSNFDADVLFNKFDKDQSGAVDYSEFASICRTKAGKGPKKFSANGTSSFN